LAKGEIDFLAERKLIVIETGDGFIDPLIGCGQLTLGLLGLGTSTIGAQRGLGRRVSGPAGCLQGFCASGSRVRRLLARVGQPPV